MKLESSTPEIEKICSMAPVIPVIVLDDPLKAVKLAETLVRGGLPVIEVTLRTPTALTAISEMSKVEGAIVGAGTLLNEMDIDAALQAGARFGVSPGAPIQLTDACQAFGLPLLPGASTPTESMSLLDRGFKYQKFFPAEAAGGTNSLKALSGPLRTIRFCPTGGISASLAPEYLRLRNVACVGGSWIAPKELVGSESWSAIERRAKQAANLPRYSGEKFKGQSAAETFAPVSRTA